MEQTIKLNQYKSFENIGAWQTGREFKNKIYIISKKFPNEEKFCLTQQIKRSAISITANIAEGYGRYNFQENIQFCRISRGSTLETIDHLYTAKDQSYISAEEFKELYELGKKTEWKINGYINFLQNQNKVYIK
ncbi:MAG: four helix bundle protein [Candidatus Falkowbacteria bacterium]|nr:four helix bundle protein [Candidatus Parcubacteria bacterium]